MELQRHKTEWIFLQGQFESYEKHSLYIKLVSIVTLFLIALAKVDLVLAISILAVLWLQDAIWKTFQSRLEPRLFDLEKFIRQESEANEFQFNTEYEKRSKSGVGLILEYIKQAVRPTIAFPHIVLILIVVVQKLLN